MKSDPSLQDGFVELYQRQLTMNIKSNSFDFQDSIMVRVFKNPNEFKIQMTSELNISFYYVANLNNKVLKVIMNGTSSDELAWLKDIFSGEKSYIFQVQGLQQATLLISYEQKYKNYELAQISFAMGSEKSKRQSLMYRYQRMKMRQKLLDGYWDHICGVVKTKNPSLLLQMENKFKKNVFR